MRYIKLILLLSFFGSTQEDNLVEKISKILPAGLPINFVEESSIPEFYVVNVANNQILYVSNDFKFVLAGEVIELSNGEINSLNDKYENKLVLSIINTLSLIHI